MVRNILLAMDQQQEREILSSFLNEEYRLICSDDYTEILSTLEKKRTQISAILIDMEMTSLDSFALLKKIRECSSFSTIPIIVCTDSTDLGTKEKVLDYGANGFISKPYKPGLIQRILLNVITMCENASLVNTLNRDKLTGLMNSSQFFEECDRRIQNEETEFFMISCLDIDNFKVINDQYGMEKGDEVLKHVASCISQCVDNIGGIACRYTADRFAVLLPAKYANSDLVLNFHKLTLTPSCLNRSIRIRIGRYLVMDSSLSANIMFDRATIAEESIKGRYDIYIADYTDSMMSNLLREQQIVNDMNGALRAGQFIPYLQPQYNHVTGALIGAEALVRWEKDGQIISPNSFIPIFEKNGFVFEIDKHIWEKVCILLKTWTEKGWNPLPISVNVSRFDLFKNEFLDVISGLVAKYHVSPELLRLEITETAFAELPRPIHDKIQKLIEKGFTVEIDDFGSGYSSLNILKDVPASILKLDMRFFAQTENSEKSGNIIESVVRMAKWLGMSIIAEGVEDLSQADFLKSIGCYYIQGFLYARPMPVAEYEKLFSSATPEHRLSRLRSLATLDNNAFWNPKSMETLIFNSYVGGACIFEYHEGNIELLRVNDQYSSELGSIISDDFSFSDMNPVNFLDEKNLQRLNHALRECINSRKVTTCELKLFRKTFEYIRITMRIIASTSDSYLFYCVLVNITEQRVAEKKRLEAEQKEMKSAQQLQVIMSNINGGVSAIMFREDRTSRLVFCNDNYYNLFGYTKEQAEAEKLDVLSLILPEDLDGVMEKIATLKRTGTPAVIEYRCKKRNGEIAYLQANSSLMHYEGYDDEIVTSVLTDITKQKLLTDQLEAIIDNINGGVTATIRKNGKEEFILVNNKYYEMLGYTKEEYEAECTDRFVSIHPEDHARIISTFMDSAYTEKQYSLEYRIIRRDGAIRFIQCNVSVIRIFGIDEQVQLAVMNDITKLREVELNERMLADEMHAVLNHAGNGITAVVMHKGSNEFLIANDKYYEILGYTRAEYEKKTHSDIFSIIDERDRAEVIEKIHEASNTFCDAVVEFRVLRPDNRMIWVKTYITVIHLFGIADPVQIAVFSDITKEKEANEQLQFLNDSAHDILEQPDVQKAIDKTLQRINGFFGGDRSYVVEFNYNRMISTNTYEFCKPGINSEKVNLQAVPFSDSQFYMETFRKKTPLYINDVFKMEDCYFETRELLLRQRIRSILLAPLFREGSLIGFIGVDNPTKAFNQIERLTALSDYFAILLTNRDLNTKIKQDSDAIRMLMDDTPGGFCRMRFYTGISPEILYANEGFTTLLKMTKEEFNQIQSSNQYHYLHHDDLAAVMDAASKVPHNGGMFSCKCRLRQKDGHFLWVMLFCRFTETPNGEVYLNSYFADISEDIRQTQKQNELLDNLPCGAALFESDGRTIRVVHLNQQYWKLVNRTPTDYSGLSVLGAVYPDDVAVINQELTDAILLNRDGSCNIRIRYGKTGYRCFRLNCRVTKKKNQHYNLYVTYNLISDTERVTEETLRQAELEYRLAIRQSGRTIGRYDIEKKTLTISSDTANRLLLPECIEDVPYGRVSLGRISSDTKDVYIRFFEDIRHGKPESSATFKKLLPKGWRFIAANATTIYSAEGKPVSALISYVDVTDQYEKDAVFKKWQQSLEARSNDSYTLLRCNLSNEPCFESADGNLVPITYNEIVGKSFDDVAALYSDRYVCEQDRAEFLSTLNLSRLKKDFSEKKRKVSLEYRELTGPDTTRYIRRTVELIERSESADIIAYIMFENIDEKKRAALEMQALAETDPLTGLLNRKTFSDKLNAALLSRKDDSMYAFFILDIDDFKTVNDTYGHMTGDRLLIDIGQTLRSAVGSEGYVCRLGGDEFVFSLRVQNDEQLVREANRIFQLTHKAITPELTTSTSIGIAVSPKDGNDFNSLYHNADLALYKIKENGKNNLGFSVSE